MALREAVHREVEVARCGGEAHVGEDVAVPGRVEDQEELQEAVVAAVVEVAHPVVARPQVLVAVAPVVDRVAVEAGDELGETEWCRLREAVPWTALTRLGTLTQLEIRLGTLTQLEIPCAVGGSL